MSKTTLRYCSKCAGKYGWPYDADKLAKLTSYYTQCGLCSYSGGRCEERPPYLLAPPESPLTSSRSEIEVRAAALLLGLAAAELKRAWDQYLTVVCDNAALLARNVAFHAAGGHSPFLSVSPEHTPESVRAAGEKANDEARHAWVLAFVAYQAAAKAAKLYEV